MRPESLAGTSQAAWLPSVPGILTGDQVLATGQSIAAVQQRDGAIGWPDGHVDAWNHVECAMALSVCGLRGAARRGYEWLRSAHAAHAAGDDQLSAQVSAKVLVASGVEGFVCALHDALRADVDP